MIQVGLVATYMTLNCKAHNILILGKHCATTYKKNIGFIVSF